jgi:hypothetical protein
VRFADPAAWIVASATSLAVEGIKELVDLRDSIGIVVVSSDGPQTAMAEVEEGGRSGFSSPLRYAASSPGSLAGVSCIAFGLRGPTMNVTMSLQEGIPVGVLICSTWLARGIARKMVLATFRKTAASGRLGRAVLVSLGYPSERQSPFDRVSLAWLAGCTTEDGTIA